MSDVNRTIIFDTIVSGGTGSGCNIVNFEIDTFASGSTTDNYSYLGYGEPAACKILRVHTLSGSSYNSFWSNGEETLDKIWDNRLSYPYF
jgi:hypothetical protein